MPTYEYSCNDCGEQLEVVQSIHDDSLTSCPNCGGTLRKHFGNVGVVFKGSGFYKTDSREKKPAKSGSKKVGADAAASTESSGSTESSSSSSDSSSSANNGSSEAKPKADTPAAKPASTPASTGSTS